MSESTCRALVRVEPGKQGGHPWDETELLSRVAAVAEYMGNGMTCNDACARAGIPRTTYGRAIRENARAWTLHARARIEQANTLADEALDVARSRSATLVEAQDKRNHIDTLKWLCAKLHPRTYGNDKLIAVTGADGGPLTVEHKHTWDIAGRRVTF